MPKASHAAARAPQQAEEPKATLSQLREFVAQMEKGSVERAYMQDFLRRRLVRPVQAVVPRTQPVPSELLAKVEELAREHYPQAVNEILEVVAPFCDSGLDLEFKPFERDDPDMVCRALFWLPIHKVEVVSLVRYDRSKNPDTGDITRISASAARDMFAEVLRTYEHMNAVSTKGVFEIRMHIYSHLCRRFALVGPCRYEIFSAPIAEQEVLCGSIASALGKAMLFAITGDRDKLGQVMNFLGWQCSGRPVMKFRQNTAYVYALGGAQYDGSAI